MTLSVGVGSRTCREKERNAVSAHVGGFDNYLIVFPFAVGVDSRELCVSVTRKVYVCARSFARVGQQSLDAKGQLVIRIFVKSNVGGGVLIRIFDFVINHQNLIVFARLAGVLY